MDYRRHYEMLIQRARFRELSGYRERHHITPRCMGGDDADTNIVELTAEEHYVAHQLLVKLFPRVAPLVTVTMLMGKKSPNNKAYGWLRRRNARAVGEMKERNAKISSSLMGNTRASGNLGKKREPFSEQWKQNIAAGKMGQIPWIAGRRQSEQAKMKMSLSRRRFSDDEITAIRSDRRTQIKIASDYSISQQYVSKIQAHKVFY